MRSCSHGMARYLLAVPAWLEVALQGKSEEGSSVRLKSGSYGMARYLLTVLAWLKGSMQVGIDQDSQLD